jgi:opacity protein-like surface antigen
MRIVHLASLLAVLAALAACSDPVQPSEPLAASHHARLGIGLYMGSGTSVATPDSTESLAAGRGSGYLGNGY